MNADWSTKTFHFSPDEKIIGLKYIPHHLQPEVGLRNLQFMVSRPTNVANQDDGEVQYEIFYKDHLKQPEMQFPDTKQLEQILSKQDCLRNLELSKIRYTYAPSWHQMRKYKDAGYHFGFVLSNQMQADLISDAGESQDYQIDKKNKIRKIQLCFDDALEGMILYDKHSKEIKSLGMTNTENTRSIEISEDEKIIGLKFEPVETDPLRGILNLQFIVSKPKK